MVVSRNRGTPKSSILMGFSHLKQPFGSIWGYCTPHLRKPRNLRASAVEATNVQGWKRRAHACETAWTRLARRDPDGWCGQNSHGIHGFPLETIHTRRICHQVFRR